jgi:hypothetical protein
MRLQSRMVNSQIENDFGADWSQPGWDDGAKSLKIWWPGTELNRRRQPFQGYIML